MVAMKQLKSLYGCLPPFLSLVILSSCSTTTGYQKPISNFQNATASVTQSTRIYINQLNKTERDAYIDEQASKAHTILLSEIESKQVFSSEAIQARIDALNALNKYGQLLGQLANSDAPEKITSNAANMEAAIELLSTDIGTLSGDNNTAFIKAFGPVGTLIGEIARFSVEKKISEALNKAITEGEEPIKKLIDVLKDDIRNAYKRKRNALSKAREIYRNGYEEERVKEPGNVVNLRARATEIKSSLDLWEAFPLSNPSDGFDALAKAHGDLVTYANSPKKSGDLATLAAQMEDFAERAKRVENAVKQLQQLNNN
jgi:hypothetical protein